MENMIGKLLMNCWKFIKFVGVFFHQNFAPYGTYTCIELCVCKSYVHINIYIYVVCVATLGGDSANQNPSKDYFKHDSKYYLCMQHWVFTVANNNGIIIGSFQ